MGAWGVGLLMLLENVFPPIPSELIMPLAGFYARDGRMGLVPVIVIGSLGSLLGTCGWYLLGHWLGPTRVNAVVERYGKWLTISTEDVAKAQAWLLGHGWWALAFGRLVPGVRTLISLPAGLSGVPFSAFLLFSTVGTVVWTTLLAVLGYALGAQHALVSKAIGPLSWVVLGVIVTLYLRRVWMLSRPRTS
jgi:membrane protein DedA with SNARE-associated domain